MLSPLQHRLRTFAVLIGGSLASSCTLAQQECRIFPDQTGCTTIARIEPRLLSRNASEQILIEFAEEGSREALTSTPRDQIQVLMQQAANPPVELLSMVEQDKLRAVLTREQAQQFASGDATLEVRIGNRRASDKVTLRSQPSFRGLPVSLAALGQIEVGQIALFPAPASRQSGTVAIMQRQMSSTTYDVLSYSLKLGAGMTTQLMADSSRTPAKGFLRGCRFSYTTIAGDLKFLSFCESGEAQKALSRYESQRGQPFVGRKMLLAGNSVLATAPSVSTICVASQLGSRLELLVLNASEMDDSGFAVQVGDGMSAPFVAMADLNQDGPPDILAIDPERPPDRRVTVWMNREDQFIIDSRLSSSVNDLIKQIDPSIFITGLVLADFDRDGISDILIRHKPDTTETALTSLSLLLGLGAGRFAGPMELALPNQLRSPLLGKRGLSLSDMSVGDADSDGDLDVLWYGQALPMSAEGSVVALLLNDTH